MNFDILGNLGEFIGAIGVVVSLIYLSTQLKQNTKALRASEYQEISRNSIELHSLFIRDADVAEIFARGRDGGRAALDDVEGVRWHSLLLAIFRHWDNLFYQFRNDTLEPELWKSYRYVIRSYLSEPGLQEWYHEHRLAFSGSLQELIDRFLAEQPIPLPPPARSPEEVGEEG